MWLDILNGFGNAFAAFRTAQDAGIWLVQVNAEAFNNYLESYLIEKEKL